MGEQKKPRKSLGRRLAYVLAMIVALAVMALVTLKYWLAPAIIRQQLQAAAADVWDGQVDFEGLQFNYTGPVVVRGLRLDDAMGRRWAWIESATITLEDWPGLAPKITAIDVGRVELRAHVRDGQCRLPVKPLPAGTGQAPSSAANHIALTRIQAPNISVTLYEDNRPRVVLDGLGLTVLRGGREYRVRLGLPEDIRPDPAASAPAGAGPPTPPNQLALVGRINANTLQAKLQFTVDRWFGAVEIEPILRAFRASEIVSASGIVTADATITGPLDDPAALRLQGKAAVRYGKVARKAGSEKVAFRCTLDGDIERLDVRAIAIEAFDGRATGQLYLEPAKTDGQYGGQMKFEKLDLVRVLQFATGKPVKQGRVTGAVTFDMPGLAPKAASMTGTVVVNGADLSGEGAIARILRAVFLRLGPVGEALRSDIAVDFEYIWPVMKLRKAQAANAIAALEAQPGGTIDFDSQQINIYVIGVPLKHARTLLQEIPVLKQILQVKDRLIRLRLYGKWNDNVASLLHIQPVGELAKDTLTFLRHAAQTGGHLGGEAVGLVGKVLKPLGNLKP